MTSQYTPLLYTLYFIVHKIWLSQSGSKYTKYKLEKVNHLNILPHLILKAQFQLTATPLICAIF